MQELSNIYTVGEINEHVKNILDSDYVLKDVLVRGEISNYKKHTSGHHYFSLKDKDGVISAVLFKFDAYNVNFTLKDGAKVIISGKVSSFVKSGQYQLYAKEIMQDGIGDLHKAFEELKQKLYKEGLFANENKKPLPRFPEKIAIVTSETGAVFSDMKRVISNRYNLCEILLYPVKVQGEGSAESITEAINEINNEDTADVIIIGRGGGSIEDLWAFNDETLAYTIFASNIPIISAVGHEPDFVISDFVADVRASTPSNAGELVVPDKTSVNAFLDQVKFALSSEMTTKIGDLKKDLQILKQGIITPAHYIKERALQVDFLTQKLINPQLLIDERKQKSQLLCENLNKSYDKTVLVKKQKFENNIVKLDGLSPLKILSRGYGYSVDSKGKIIKTVKQIKMNDEIKTHYFDGLVTSKIVDIKE